MIGMSGYLPQERMGAVHSFFGLVALPSTMRLGTFTTMRNSFVGVAYFVPFVKCSMDNTCA